MVWQYIGTTGPMHYRMRRPIGFLKIKKETPNKIFVKDKIKASVQKSLSGDNFLTSSIKII